MPFEEPATIAKYRREQLGESQQPDSLQVFLERRPQTQLSAEEQQNRQEKPFTSNFRPRGFDHEWKQLPEYPVTRSL